MSLMERRWMQRGPMKLVMLVALATAVGGTTELQWYRPENTQVVNGELVISATKVGSNLRKPKYYSSRSKTAGIKAFHYGYFESRIKKPTTQGIWPAFWMMPQEEKYGVWPKSGEIDTMETLGSEPKTSYGTMHYGEPYPNNLKKGSSFHLNAPNRFTDDYHLFAVDNSPQKIIWFVDGVEYFSVTSQDLQGAFWPFEESFYFILNVAIGGNWPGSPDLSTVWPQMMRVDYVRAYQGENPFGTLVGPKEVTSAGPQMFYIQGNGITSLYDSYQWEVPAGATILSGQNTDTIHVSFGTTSGTVKVAAYTSECGSRVFQMPVGIQNTAVRVPLESAGDENDQATFTWTSSQSYDLSVANPLEDPVNPSPLLIR